ncbi:exodeoxyribonuclease VII large subunit [Helicobacter sp. 12S02634-8]|nr:exodeoxyribonuclease VII large subunit [Helicobacter sp. 12S02634-8]
MESTFLNVSVMGEISNLTKHSSGHIYFSIKDEGSSIRCVLFKGNAQKVRFELANGVKIIVYGALSVYVPRGEYQITCKMLEPSGFGALSLAYEQLKSALEQKGYFDIQAKKKLPPFPTRIALITSSTGAALQDMKRVAQSRWPLCVLVGINTLVQGEGAKFDIAKNIGYADSFYGTPEGFDVIVVARGGGSIEDLWAFNEEIVADAIFKAQTPIVSAVGHEIDFVISDFVADLRAPTPSACMEMVLPDQREWLMRLDEMSDLLQGVVDKFLCTQEQACKALIQGFEQVSYEAKFQRAWSEIEALRGYFCQSFQNMLDFKAQLLSTLPLELKMEGFLSAKAASIQEMQLSLESKNPKNFVQSGYAQILYQGKITSLEKLQPSDVIEISDGLYCLQAQITQTSKA